MTDNLEQLLLRFVREFTLQFLKHLLGEVSDAIGHSVQHFLGDGEKSVRNVPEILQVVDKRPSRLRVFDGLITAHVGIATASLTR